MIPSGWVVPLPIALPNVLWALFPGPEAASPPATSESPLWRFASLIEGAGRVAVFTLPFVLDWNVETAFDRVLVSMGGLALALYYVAWSRYFLCGRADRLLFAALGPVSVPLAIAPILYFVAFAGLAGSSTMGAVTAVFGAAHILLSLRRSRSA